MVQHGYCFFGINNPSHDKIIRRHDGKDDISVDIMGATIFSDVNISNRNFYWIHEDNYSKNLALVNP